MFTVDKNVDLSSLNTLGAPSIASDFATISNEEALTSAVEYSKTNNLPIRVLGGGSNLVLSERISALVLHCNIKGIETVSETSDAVIVSVGAGETWHEFVEWSIGQSFYGLENLALIPGTVGAAPVQNIGAYGVEVQSTIHQVQAINLNDGTPVSFNSQQSQFAYRDSIFKRKENQFFISRVLFRLSKVFNPVLTYGPLQVLKESEALSARVVFNRVVHIRQEKLPDPKSIPNAGSYFKNPIVDLETYNRLSKKFPALVSYEFEGAMKLAAGWLIDQCGLKGTSSRVGVGCYEKQALVIINPQRAGQSDISEWATYVNKVVFEKFGVTLETEPRLWD